MCIRSNHGAITAWCATLGNIASINLPTLYSHQDSTDSRLPFKPLGISFLVSLSFCRYSVLCLLLITHSPILVTALSSSSSTIDRRSMVTKANDFDGFPPRVSSLFKYPYRRRIKLALPQHPKRHAWTSDLVTFICDELTDPCTRAAFLRRHVYHEICSDLPPLYLLPHIDDDENKSDNHSPTQLCNSRDKGVRSTDGLYRRYLATPSNCRKSLEALDTKIRSSLSADLDIFSGILERSFCILAKNANNTMVDECIQCRKAYWSWACATTFPVFYPLAKLSLHVDGEEKEADALPNVTSFVTTSTAAPSTTPFPSPSSIETTENTIEPSQLQNRLPNTSSLRQVLPPARLKSKSAVAVTTMTFALESVAACMTWCTQVETLCPYFNPSDLTSNGGESTFLCDESHYRYEPTDSLHSVDYFTGCELDCCFTEQDFLIDGILDESAPHDNLPSTASTTGRWAKVQMNEAMGERVTEQRKRYFSLTERCLYQIISKSRGVEAPPLVDPTLARQSASLSSSTLPNAFFLPITAAIVIFVVCMN